VSKRSEKPGQIDVIRALASAVAERASFASKAGITFGGNRDLFQALGYKRKLDTTDYRSRYCRNGIAARVVESLPQATWRGGADIIEDDNPEVVTPFEAAFLELSQELRLWQMMLRADILSGLGRYAVLILGAPGDASNPLPTTMTAEQLAYIQPYAEDEAKIVKFDDSPESRRFGEAKTYAVTRSSNGGTASTSKNVDYSRVIHVADGLLEDRVYGRPRLERIWNWLDDLEKLTGAGAESFWLRAHQGFYYNLDKDLQLKPGEAEKLEEAADELANGMRRTMAARGMEVKALGSDVANFNQQVDAIITLIAGATGIPKRILVGTERGELSSTQDKTNWDERVHDRRQEYAEPQILRPLIDKLIECGVLPRPVLGYKVVWPDVAILNMTEAAAVALQWNTLGEDIVTKAEIRDRVLGLPPLEDVVDEVADDTPAEEPPADGQEPPPEGEVPAPEEPPADGQKPPTPPQGARTAMARERLRGLKRSLRDARRRGKERPRDGRGLMSIRPLKLVRNR